MTLLLRLALALAALPALAPAHAGSLGISPMRLEFGTNRQIAHLTLTNVTQETLTVETEALPWPREAEGQGARDLVVNPPVATLQPGARLTVRVGLVRRATDDRERAYRVYFTELPAPRAGEAPGIGVRLRVGIPVFVAARQPQREPLQWHTQADADGLLLVAHNPGNVHHLLQRVQVSRGDAPALQAQGLPYVLPGATATFRVPGLDAAAAAGALRVEVQSSDTAAQVVELPPR